MKQKTLWVVEGFVDDRKKPTWYPEEMCDTRKEARIVMNGFKDEMLGRNDEDYRITKYFSEREDY